MGTPISTGSSGSGFLTSTAMLLAVVLLVVVAAAMPTVKSAIGSHIEQFRHYFFGPAPEDADRADAAPASDTPEGSRAADGSDAESDAQAQAASGRASDREQYEFDLDVFSDLFDGPVHGPPPGS